MFKSIWFILLAAYLASCNNGSKSDDRVVARVYDSYLYLDDLAGLAEDLSPEDSTVFIKNYIYNWGKEQLLVNRAEYNLKEQEQEFEELVTQYKNDLIKHAYLEKYISQKLDTSVSVDEIRDYYNEHSADFELKENILKCDFYIMPQIGDDIEKAKYWWRNATQKNDEKFIDFASVYAIQKVVGDTNWVSYADLAKDVPLPNYNQQQFLSQNKRVIFEDSSKVYFLNIVSFKIKDNASPLAYVSETIRSIILNKRKLDLISEMEDNLVKDAFKKQNFEIY